MALIWSSLTSFDRPERCSSLSEKYPERNLSNQFRHTHHVIFWQPILRSFLYGNKKAKYDENAPFYTPS